MVPTPRDDSPWKTYLGGFFLLIFLGVVIWLISWGVRKEIWEWHQYLNSLR